jgi:hypothetical protein
VRIVFLSPHVRIAGGVRAILTYADRLVRRGHDVSVIVPAGSRWRAWRRNRSQPVPDWMPGLRARLRWVNAWDPSRLPDGDALVATAWQTRRRGGGGTGPLRRQILSRAALREPLSR